LLKNVDDDGEAEMIAKLELLGFNSTSGVATAVKKEVASAVSFEVNEDSRAKKPLPDYERVKAEARGQQLRIKEFFAGDPNSASGKRSRELGAIEAEMEVMDKEKTFNVSTFRVRAEGEHEIVRVLPAVDSQFQMEVRRKIFYEKLVK
jgi:hypothetical protein